MDLAANHAVFLSNTRALERDYGWHGVCIEANPRLVAELREVRKCTVVQALVGAGHGQLAQFTEAEDDGLSRVTASGVEVSKNATPTTSLGDILKHVGAPKVIDYLSLDVEGFEDVVMSTFPWSSTRINAITVERPSQSVRAVLDQRGFVYAFDHGWFGDALYLHRDFPFGVGPAIERARAALSQWFLWWCPREDGGKCSVTPRDGKGQGWRTKHCPGVTFPERCAVGPDVSEG